MAIKKSQIYRTLWNSCDLLRGAMDASQYKDYVLVLLFVKYVSDKAKNDLSMIVPVPEDCRFDEFVKLKNNPNIGEEINKKLAKLGRAFMLEGVITNADFNDENRLGKGKNLVERVSKLIGVFENSELDFGGNRASDDDIMGDAYEYLMRNFAQQSGKSKGQFYTPAEVSRLMAKLIGISKLPSDHKNVSIYDPTCGSGSLLLRARAEAKCDVSVNGQEMDLATIGMAKMNMILHGEWAADLQHDDVLNYPQHKIDDSHLQQFDFIVANPPFSQKEWLMSGHDKDNFGRWSPELLPPNGNGDMAFLMHIIKSLKPGGNAAVILPHGVLFRGGREADIRKKIIDEHMIKGIVGLPSNLFYGTGIPASIILLHKPLPGEKYEGVFMIDAKDSGKKDGPKQRLMEKDIRRIVDVWESESEISHFSHFASLEEITDKNGYNLNIPRYVSPKSKEVEQDIQAHLYGGIPNRDIESLDALWNQAVTLKDTLFEDENNGYSKLKCNLDELNEVMTNEPSMKVEEERFTDCINEWESDVMESLTSFDIGSEVKPLIDNLGKEVMIANEIKDNLVDAYDLYECVMSYWNGELINDANMQDDCYQVSAQGWKVELNEPDRKTYNWKDLECDLLPVEIVANRYFEDNLNEMKEVEAEISKIQSEIDALAESEAADCKSAAFPEKLFGDKPRLSDVKAMIKEAENQKVGHTPDQLRAWKKFVSLNNKMSVQKKVLSQYNSDLIDELKAKYEALTESDVHSLVVNDKWLATLKSSFYEEHSKAIVRYENQIKEISERYAESLESLTLEADKLKVEVNGILRKMGFKF